MRFWIQALLALLGCVEKNFEDKRPFTLGPDLQVPIHSCNLIGLELQVGISRSHHGQIYKSQTMSRKSYVAVLFGFMGWDLGKELGPEQMEIQLQT
jgi:hypothetical protein